MVLLSNSGNCIFVRLILKWAWPFGGCSVCGFSAHWYLRYRLSVTGLSSAIPLLPAALRPAQACRYLIYSEADFEVFRPAGATCCTDGGEIWRGGGDRSPRQISPPSVQRQGCRTPKLKFLLRFHKNVEYKRPTGAYSLCDFHKICRVCTPFQDALGVKISLDLVEGLWSYGGF